MFKHEIDRLFTEKVAEYLSKGYWLNPDTMGGSQGEIAKVDLNNGQEIIRVLLDRKTTFMDGTQVSLKVGRNTDKLYGSTFDTIWHEHLEILEERTFCEVARNFYVTPDEYPAIREKRFARYAQRQPTPVDLGEKAKEIVLPFVRRQSKCKRAKLSDIENVRKSVNRGGKTVYTAQVKGRTFLIH